MPAKYNPEQRLEAFWAKVDKTSSPNGCWLWTGGKDPKGYGVLAFETGKLTRAHRVAYQLMRGDIPAGLFVLHDCPNGDNPTCVNPAHLWLGTPADNSADMVRKGRQGSLVHPERLARGDRSGARLHPETRPRGEAHVRAKLTENNVREIHTRHANGEAARALAREYGVSRAAINAIIKRRNWKHIPSDLPIVRRVPRLVPERLK